MTSQAMPPRPRKTKAEAAPHHEGRPLMVRRARKSDENGAVQPESRLFVTALARGLEILSAFRIGDGPLGNQELARRSNLPKPTVSRMTHTLAQLGYLTFNPGAETYELGGRSLALGYAAISNMDIRRVARPIMREIAERENLHIALGIRDRLMILTVDTWEGKSLIGLRLPAGARMPIATTSAGKAYLAMVPEEERTRIMEEVQRQHGDEWGRIQSSITQARRDMAQHGYCLSLGEWQNDINGAGAAVVLPNGSGVYALSIGGPAYMVNREQLKAEYGPMLAAAARRIEAELGAESRPDRFR